MKTRFLMVWTVILLAAMTAFAQGAPEQIHIAVRDLSARLGKDVFLTSMDKWNWEQVRFPDSSLGCPAPGQIYQQVQTLGYIFTLVYRGTTYDYRVSNDGLIVYLCQNNTPSTPVVPFIPGQSYSNPLCPAPETGKLPYMRNRVMPGVAARSDSDQPTNLRETPSLNGSVQAQIPVGAAFQVVAGPTCAEEIVWWQVDYDGRRGFIAEGQNSEYFIEPFPPQALPRRSIIYADNALQLAPLAQVQGNFQPRFTWSPSGQYLALLGASGSDALWLYMPEQIASPPVLILQDDRMVSLDFHPNESQILYSTGDGGAHLINIRGDVPVREAMFLKTHQSSSVIALFPDGTKFVAGGFGAQSSVNVDRTNAMVIWDFQTVSQTAVIPGHPSSVIDLEFSPNGLWLVSADNGGNAMITNVAQPETRINLNGIGARAVAFSPNSQFFAVAKSNGTIDLMIPATGAVITTFSGHTAGVTNVVFSPDSTLLASVGEDGTLRLWSTQTDQSAGVIQTGGRGIRDVAFNPAGNLIAVVGDDFTLRLFGIRAAA